MASNSDNKKWRREMMKKVTSTLAGTAMVFLGLGVSDLLPEGRGRAFGCGCGGGGCGGGCQTCCNGVNTTKCGGCSDQTYLCNYGDGNGGCHYIEPGCQRAGCAPERYEECI